MVLDPQMESSAGSLVCAVVAGMARGRWQVMSVDYLPNLQGQPDAELGARVRGLLGDYGGERLPLLTVAEA